MASIRYTQLAHELGEGIRTGFFPVGSLLPTELELAEQHATSRHTVRMALNELQALGLVSRRKNVGTRVESAAPTGGYRQALGSVEDLAQFGAEHVRTVQSAGEIVADIALAKRLGCPGGTRWLHIATLRQSRNAGGEPMGWTDLYIDPDYSDVADAVRDEPRALVSSLIESRHGRHIARITQEIEPVALPPELAAPLCAEAGSPALCIVRRYYDAQREPFEITVTVHPMGRFTFSMELTRSRA
ncbi:MAG: GntR family transcriptional regulator [Pseudomonadota bacterium]|nr:GntR family transcriptional regulator [Pseudomonadota bacterium]